MSREKKLVNGVQSSRTDETSLMENNELLSILSRDVMEGNAVPKDHRTKTDESPQRVPGRSFKIQSCTMCHGHNYNIFIKLEKIILNHI